MSDYWQGNSPVVDLFSTVNLVIPDAQPRPSGLSTCRVKTKEGILTFSILLPLSDMALFTFYHSNLLVVSSSMHSIFCTIVD